MALSGIISLALQSIPKDQLSNLKTGLAAIKTTLTTAKAQKQAALAYIQIPQLEAEFKKTVVSEAIDKAKSSLPKLPANITRAIPELGVLNTVAEDAMATQIEALEYTLEQIDRLKGLSLELVADTTNIENSINIIEQIIDGIDQILGS